MPHELISNLKDRSNNSNLDEDKSSSSDNKEKNATLLGNTTNVKDISSTEIKKLLSMLSKRAIGNETKKIIKDNLAKVKKKVTIYKKGLMILCIK